MLERARGQYTIEGTVEDIYGGVSGAARIARISQTFLFSGALEGESVAEYTAVLPRDGNGSFQGYQRITGALGEREGTFVVCVTGEYLKGQPRGVWSIVPKSGSGDFVHIRGGGTFTQSAGKTGSYSFEFDLRKPRASRTASAAAEPDELIPGIDIVAEEDAAIEPVEATIPATVDEAETKPKRRTRKPAQEASPPSEVAIAPPERVAQARPKRSRAVSAPAEPIATVPDAKPKRSRKKTAVETAPVEPAETIAITQQAPSKRSRRKLDPAPVAVEPATAPETPRRRTRAKPAPPVEPVSVTPVETPEPKPARRKKAAPVPPPEPVPLPVAAGKPPRQRKAKAA